MQPPSTKSCTKSLWRRNNLHSFQMPTKLRQFSVYDIMRNYTCSRFHNFASPFGRARIAPISFEWHFYWCALWLLVSISETDTFILALVSPKWRMQTTNNQQQQRNLATKNSFVRCPISDKSSAACVLYFGVKEIKLIWESVRLFWLNISHNITKQYPKCCNTSIFSIY